MSSGTKRMASIVRSSLEKNWDWWTVIEGPEGVGKSTLAIWFAHYVSGPKFNVSEHICYDPLDFLTQVDTAPRYGTIIIDEAAELWYSRDFATRANKALAKASTQVRDRNLNIILCLPSIHMLDKAGLRRHKTKAVVSAPGGIRGKSDWFRPYFPSHQPVQTPFWELKFIDYFPQLPEHIEKAYLETKTRQSLERMEGYKDALQPTVKKERKEWDYDKIVAEILASDDPKWRSARGKYTIATIAAATKMPLHHARAVVAVLHQHDKP